MTRDEAIMVLNANYPDACYSDLRKAFDVAIQSLGAWDDILSQLTNEVEENGHFEWRPVLYVIREKSREVEIDEKTIPQS